MIGHTYRAITLLFCLVFATAWAWLTWINRAMYVPPGEIQVFLVALLSGKLAQSLRPPTKE